MLSVRKRAIVKTLAYADIFDYPLTEKEIGKWLIKLKMQNAKCKIITANTGSPAVGRDPAEAVASCGGTIKNSKLIKEKDGFYFLNGRESIIDLRKRKRKYSREKFKIAQRITSFLKLIPTVKLIGITGALANNNTGEKDDIDLFIIASAGLLWTTRFLVTGVLEILGKRRHPDDKEVDNKICLNMFMDEDHLTIPREEQDLFSAHEVVQMRPLYDKNQTYQKFLKANLWVRKYLPNAMETKNNKQKTINKKRKKILIHNPSLIIRLLEESSKRFQLWYMRRRRTTEKISNGIIRFHPQDARVWVLKAYRKKLSHYSP